MTALPDLAKPGEWSGLLTELRDGILTVTLNRPQAANGLTVELSDALMTVLSAVNRDPRVRVVILTGAGKNFSAGGDVRLIERNIAASRTSRKAAFALQRPSHDLAAAIEHCRPPVIAAVNGAAAGMGLVLALSADILVAAPDTRLVYAYTSVGLPGDGGVTRRLVKRVGLGRALEFALLDRPLDAATALHWGLVNRIAEAGETALACATPLAHQLARGPAIALAGIKRAMRTDSPRQEHVSIEIDAFIEAAQSDDVLEGVSAIREKRRPDFAGPRPTPSSERP